MNAHLSPVTSTEARLRSAAARGADANLSAEELREDLHKQNATFDAPLSEEDVEAIARAAEARRAEQRARGGITFNEMLERFAVVKIGGKPRVMELSSTGQIVELYEFQDFKNYFVRESVSFTDPATNKVVTMKTTQYWLQHTASKRYARIVYDMPGSPLESKAGPNDFNAYQGFTVTPCAGDWSKNRAFILDIICSGDETLFRWVMNWVAALMQKPGRRAGSALVLMAGQGVGKGHFAKELLGGCFHAQQFVQINGASELTEQFNDILSGKTLIFADESTWGGDPRAVGRLKGLVTEERITVDRKFLPKVSEPSALHIVIASNEDFPVRVDADDRRFCVLNVSNTRQKDTIYFAALHAELAQGGRAAMLAELLSYEVDWDLLREPPATAQKAQLVAHSLNPIEEWWRDVLDTGRLVDGKWPEKVSKRALVERLRAYLREDSSTPARATTTKLGTYLRQTFKFEDTQEMVDGERDRYWTLPPLAECRSLWEAKYGRGASEWSTFTGNEVSNLAYRDAEDAPEC